VIGCGYFAGFHHDAWARLEKAGEVEVIAVCDRDEAKAEAAAAHYSSAVIFSDLAALIAARKPDLVDIVTPPQTHAALIGICAEAGVDVICQKPLAPSLEQARILVDRAEHAGIRLVVHENFRFQPWYREAQRLVEAGRLGRLHDVVFRMRPGDGQGPDAYLARQPYFQQMERFLIHETGIHFIDTFRMLMGEVVAVTAVLRRLNPAIKGEDSGQVILEFESGATGLLDANRLNDHVAENPRLTMGEMWLAGEGGVLRLDGDGGLHLKPHHAPEALHPYDWDNIGFGGDCVMATTRAALHAIRDGTDPANTGRAYLRNMEIVEAIYRSSEEGRRIEL
jgi:predicted dehydrogenase